MSRYVLSFEEAGAAGVSRVGGKGANLGRLSGIEGIRVPGGFCVTTEAYKCIIGQIPDFGSMMEQLSLLKAEDRDGIDKVSQRVRKSIERIKIPEDMKKEIGEHITKLGSNYACAVRSSATAEDLSTASFAGLCLRRTPSHQTVRCCPLMPASGWGKPWFRVL